MDLDRALLGCNVSNNYTVVKNKPKYDTTSLIVECKLQSTSCFPVMQDFFYKKNEKMLI